MADTLKIRRWDNSESADKLTGLGSVDGYVEFKDEDLGIPANYKRFYGWRISYLTHGTPAAKGSTITYALDGATAMITTGIPSGNFDNGTTVMGDELILSPVAAGQSIKTRFEFDAVDGIYELRDIGLECRPIHKRVT